MTIIEPKTCICDHERNGCQDIGETWNWGWNGDQFFAERPGDTISSVVWTVPPELNLINQVEAGRVFYALIENVSGVAEETYPLISEMTTSAGEIVRFRINIKLGDITAN